MGGKSDVLLPLIYNSYKTCAYNKQSTKLKKKNFFGPAQRELDMIKNSGKTSLSVSLSFIHTETHAHTLKYF